MLEMLRHQFRKKKSMAGPLELDWFPDRCV